MNLIDVENETPILLNILGIPRWATLNEDGSYDVSSTYHNGTYYESYTTHGDHPVLWNVYEQDRYPTKEEFETIIKDL